MILFRLYFVHTDLKTHLEILRILERIFLRSHVSSIVNDDHLIPSESILFTSLKFLVSILFNDYPNIMDDSSLFPAKFNQNLQIIELIIELLIKLCITDESK